MTRIEIIDFEKKFKNAKQGIAEDLEASLKAKLAPGGRGYDTGLGSANIKVRIADDGSIEISMPKWMWYVEWGTPGAISAPAGMSPNPNRKYPMYKDGDEWKTYLDDWARRKLGITDKNDLFVLARHIQLFGTRPFPFIRTTFTNNLIPIVKENLKKSFG